MAHGPLITPADLPVQVVTAPQPSEGKKEGAGLSLKSLEEAENARILDALSRHNGNRTRAAKDLGISRTTLWKKLNSIAAFEKGTSYQQ
jgi:transcriptional regulator with PAS, ATPase and Fis domain